MLKNKNFNSSMILVILAVVLIGVLGFLIYRQNNPAKNISSSITSLTLDQPSPTFNDHPISNNGAQVGDMAFFEAPLFQNGKVVGELTGSRVLTETAKQLSWATKNSVNGASSNSVDDLWLNTMTFYIYGKGSLLVEGNRLIPENTNPSALPQIPSADTETIAVIGGTGDFKFAHGQLSSFRQLDGTYVQTFNLEK
jgi:hypothetical protein